MHFFQSLENVLNLTLIDNNSKIFYLFQWYETVEELIWFALSITIKFIWVVEINNMKYHVEFYCNGKW